MNRAPLLAFVVLTGCAQGTPDIAGTWVRDVDYLSSLGEPVCGGFENRVILDESGEMMWTLGYLNSTHDEDGRHNDNCSATLPDGTYEYRYFGSWRVEGLGDLFQLALTIEEVTLNVEPLDENDFDDIDHLWDGASLDTGYSELTILSGEDAAGDPYLWINGYGMHRPAL